MASVAFEAFLEANREAQRQMGEVSEDDPWQGSPFEWIKKIPSSRRRGKAGELLVAAWLRRLGLVVEGPFSADHDCVVNGRRVEVKFSTLWGAGGYTFQQLRDQDYEFVILMGLSPDAAHIWIVPKAKALANSVPQHGGAAGKDTRWVTIQPNTPPAWLRKFGGDLVSAEAAARGTFRVTRRD